MPHPSKTIREEEPGRLLGGPRARAARLRRSAHGPAPIAPPCDSSTGADCGALTPTCPLRAWLACRADRPFRRRVPGTPVRSGRPSVDEMDRRFTQMVAELQHEMLGPFDEIYRRFERLEQEYQQRLGR